MSGTVRAELRKITTTRPWWILLVCILVLSGAGAALVALLSPGGRAGFDDPGIVRSIYHGGNPLTRVLVMVLGIAAVASEYRHHTLAATYLATPRRTRVLLGKAASLVTFGLGYGLASVGAGVAVAVPFVTANGGTLFLDRGDTWRSLVLGVVSLALWSLLGMGIGLLVQDLPVAMLVGISLVFLVEPILALVCYLRGWDAALNLLPSGATNAMLGITSPVLFAGSDPYPWWPATLVLLAWCLLPVLVGVLAAVRGDVT